MWQQRTVSRAAMALCLALSIEVTSVSASAQVSNAELAARRVWIEQASAARQARRFADALSLAERAGRVQMTPSLRLFIAEVYSAMGNHVDALATAERCASEADRDTAASNRVSLLNSCRALSASSRQRVGQIVFSRPPEGVTVRVGESTLSETLFEAPFVVNPGTIRVRATGEGFVEYMRDVDVRAGESVTVSLDVQRAQRTSANTAAIETPHGNTTGTADGHSTTATLANARSSSTVDTARGVPVDAPRRSVSPGAIVVGAVGVAGLGASLAFLLARNAALTGCSIEGSIVWCDTEQQRANALDANTWATLSGVSFGVGLTALIGGAVWIAVDATRGRSRRAIPTVISVSNAGLVVGVSGRF